MKPQNELALIVSYFLSRLDKKGHALLGYKSFNEAANKIGSILDVKPNTIKNMRDEFDPYHQNNRVGWKKELRGSRLKIMNAFQETDDETLLEIVREILNNKDFQKSDEHEDIQNIFKDKERSKRTSIFILRGPTGKAAENFFINDYSLNKKPIEGDLIDCRDLGSGYDFEIRTKNGPYLVEVKGVSVEQGGILFTNKEWQTALKHKDRYYLAIVNNLSSQPSLTLIQNPAAKLDAIRKVYTTLQVSWTVGAKNLMKNSEEPSAQ